MLEGVIFLLYFIAIFRPITEIIGTRAASNVVIWTSDHVAAFPYNKVIDQEYCTESVEFGT